MTPKQPRILPMRHGYDATVGKEVVRILKSGGLVVVPTDTVYGVAADPRLPGAEDRLFRAKGISPDKPIPLLAADRSDVEAWGATFTEIDHRLARTFWPGPLTIVLRAENTYEGFRVPDFPATRAILREAGGMLRVTSAHRSGNPPAVTAEQATAAFGAVVEAVVDAGPAPGGIVSTVVKVENGRILILRSGAIPASRILELSPGSGYGGRLASTQYSPPGSGVSGKKLLIFVCTGNVCRSPMAEHFMRKKTGPDSDWDVASAGIVAADGLPASEAAVAVMAEIGIDIGAHRSQPLTRQLVNAAQLIVVMTASHREQIRALFPNAASKVRVLKSFEAGLETDIDDPVGLPLEVYRGVRDEIDRATNALLEHLKTTKEKS